MVKDPELEKQLLSFLEYFALVFDNDWDMTKSSITSEHMIARSGTFIKPLVEDEENNWANRARLLEAYRSLVALLKERNVKLPELIA